MARPSPHAGRTLTSLHALHSRPVSQAREPERDSSSGIVVLRTTADVRAAVSDSRRAGASIGLVPTMGAFHDGHLSLMRRAREECDLVVVSLFVNPTQFDEGGDLSAYPRDEARDATLAAEAGMDFMFAPSPD